ncbi:Microtubule-associated proteins 1A/1B light chain 3C [Araneus ventricosus]|uniref:Microtubule-associated proteins 1A/1B light chain 3C n=1 Tax=Araneus ventricosus TaxID=182803 RepID=A0A4Y2GF70_ARAVE|nr:Microtubule-associated proteins 1A/1B light chain 3C [Araneus ventricosus]
MHKIFHDHSDKNANAMGTFKQRKSLATRKEEVENIRTKFPTKIPVIVERYHKESQLPLLDKTKFLVPQELTVSQFLTIIRNRMHLGANQAFYLLINNRSIASMSKTVAEVYLESKDEDGFLYVTYASQEMFGCSHAPEICKQNAKRSDSKYRRSTYQN